MAKGDMERIREYHIPMNFIDESRIINGMFKTRNFIEGCVLAGAVGFPCWTGVNAPFEVKISLVVGIALPFLLIGISGINGDPLSTFIRNAIAWARSRGTMLYNNETRALAQAPIKVMMDEEGMNDKILDFVDSMKQKTAKKRSENPLIEGEDFVFAEDKSLAGNYLDEVEFDDDNEDGTDAVPVDSGSDKPPVMEVEAEVLEVTIETVSLTSNVGSEQSDSFDLFDGKSLTVEAADNPPVSESPEKPARGEVEPQNGPLPGAVQANAEEQPHEKYVYDDNEDGALF